MKTYDLKTDGAISSDSQIGSELNALLPKIRTGSLQIQWKRCGKERCRCSKGFLHGPYVDIRWRSNGCQRKAYIRLADLPIALIALQRIYEERNVCREVSEDYKCELQVSLPTSQTSDHDLWPAN